MKKILILLALFMGVVGCSKEDTPENITFTIDFNVAEGESMVRGASDLYSAFYNNFVKTKVVGYSDYSLSFYQGETLVGTFSGKWDATLVTLPEGKYRVTGSSKAPIENIKTEVKDNPSLETMSLLFDEEVEITKNTTTLSLKNPTYDCYLVFFDKTLVSEAKVSAKYGYDNAANTQFASFYEAGDVKYVFIATGSHVSRIHYKATEGDSGILELKNLGFENGKYYCLDAVVTGYQAPEMENGF